MIFHSLDFLVFFVVTVAVYWALPHRWQNRWLLVTSYFFYGYIHPWFLGLIAFSTLVDWWAARRMESDPVHRRWYLGLSIGTNMGMLGFFKYFNFFAANLSPLLASLGLASTIPSITVLLPGRDLVFHVPGPELHHRCLPWSSARPAVAGGRGHLRRPVPAAGGRTDRAGLGPAAAGRGQAHVLA